MARSEGEQAKRYKYNEDEDKEQKSGESGRTLRGADTRGRGSARSEGEQAKIEVAREVPRGRGGRVVA